MRSALVEAVKNSNYVAERNMRKIDKYLFFYSGILSNFYKVRFAHEGVVFPTSEHVFMYKKAMFFNDTDAAYKIISSFHPAEAKRLGRKVKGFDASLWEKRREEAMYEACLAKFSVPSLREYLLGTHDLILVEASPTDSIWGIGMDERTKGIENPENWKGLNLLGKVLMRVRDTLQ